MWDIEEEEEDADLKASHEVRVHFLRACRKGQGMLSTHSRQPIFPTSQVSGNP